MSVEKEVAPNRAQESVKVAAPGRVQQAREKKEGDFKSAYGGKPPKRHSRQTAESQAWEELNR